MKSLRWMASYVLVAVLGLWLAFFMSMKFMVPANSAEAPSSGELPPEFAKEAGVAPSAPVQKNDDTKAASSSIPAQVANPPSAPTPTSAPSQDPLPAPPAKAVAEKSAFALQDQYVYDPISKRDPFRPFKSNQPKMINNLPVKLEPLQEFDLDQIQIVGILWDVKNPRAMVRTPKNDLFTVYKNTKIGRNDGMVMAIREGEIVVSEVRFEDGKTYKGTRIKEMKRDKKSSISGN